MCGRHEHRSRRRHGRRAPKREDFIQALEERQKDLEQEIADIHDLLRRLRDKAAAEQAEPAPSI
jgi:predicted  nucleic acid-binding Zn-ribbon protein